MVVISVFWGLRCGFALRRCGPQLAGLLGPAQKNKFFAWSAASPHCSPSLGQKARFALLFCTTLVFSLGFFLRPLNTPFK
ncbi:hypothetical protein SGRA_0299 [Saprospira grandis str. Lewin]|uniref:Uncharacterized protein n=1 Tax=Saprospira grandis (strain Lewin) TaxID=984262 RepID=H6L7K6_SAPGL|nr:hypothetical protein SGRA_0299 [Saprospira grandis str. Lewin]